ncbi:BcsR/BcsP family cellulose biosynthesis protein [Erwinia sorbitola]|uniref:Uncharacterized protein n=1 Tax=Erwinia sorbitola TaxID=2681984 RepID=A0A6I6E7N2_9GAMM|nr:BcsR/BcsP family cellulose biosynthesis protein [Erwinia sorbitola]MTD28095.1 hypothetical protein [Erwinia sorbitola]QGU85787.1 hypothetical protein GN242_00490 [Erwinia sorbitola]
MTSDSPRLFLQSGRESSDDIRALSEAFSWTTLRYTGLARQERQAAVTARWQGDLAILPQPLVPCASFN